MGISKNMTHVDAFDEVTGSAKYTTDLEPQGLSATKVICSTVTNGVVKSFDLKEALKVPGVMEVVACFDMPGIQFPTPGHPWSVEMAHQDIAGRELLSTRVRVYGDDIATVIAENDITAARAARFVRMECEEHAPLLTVENAMTENAPRLHNKKPGNVIAHSSFVVGGGTYGDTVKEEGLVEIKEGYRTQSMQHCHIETPISFAYMEKGRITVTTSTQVPHTVRRVIGQALGLPIGRVRIIKSYIGGGFGNKRGMLYEPLNAFLTTQVGGGGVRVEISREETPDCIRVRHAIELKVKAAARKDETLVARKLEAYSNQGGYTSHTHAIVANSSNKFKQTYRDEKVLESDTWTVCTNLAIGGAVGGCGIPQAMFTAEHMADDLALALCMDPLESRRRSYMGPGYVNPHTHVKCNTYSLAECMERDRELIRRDEKRGEYENQTGPVQKGIGMAISCYKTGVYPISLETASCRMILNQDGSMQLQIGTTRVDQGADAVFTQMVAKVTGITEDKVNMLSAQDADMNLFDTGACASRQTCVSGMAMKEIGAIFKEKMLDYAAYMLEKPQDILDARDSHIVDKETGKQLLPVGELTATAFYNLDRSVHVTAETTSHCKTNTFATGVCFTRVGVDMPLGKVKVTNIVDVHNSGKLINPKLVAAQVRGGINMGLGYDLSEELLSNAKGRQLNDNLLDYKLPITMDTPDLNALFVELDDPTGLFGDRALGKPPAIPVAPAMHNAVLSAAGVAVDNLSMDLQKMVEHFRETGLI